MLWITSLLLALAWAIGLASAVTMGGLIHVLIVAAVGLALYGSYKAGRAAGGRKQPAVSSKRKYGEGPTTYRFGDRS